jgi:hypothetical protein
VVSHFKNIREPLFPENFPSKWTILAHYECNNYESDTRFLTDLKILDIHPGQDSGTTRVDLQSKLQMTSSSDITMFASLVL